MILACWHDNGRGDGFMASLMCEPDTAAGRGAQHWHDRLPLGARFEVWLHPQGQGTAEGLRDRHLVLAGRVNGREIPAARDAAVLPFHIDVEVDGELVEAVLVDGVYRVTCRRSEAA